MTKVQEGDQFQREIHIFKCWCGEESYLEITQDADDKEFYISITQHPTRFMERLKMAWAALRGIEFSSSNCVVLLEEDANKLVAALTFKREAANAGTHT
jgi:hypothetical protein